MLAAVLLHKVEAPLPVDFAAYLFPRLKGAVGKVADNAPFVLPNVKDPCAADFAEVRKLTPALREKRRFVKDNSVILQYVKTFTHRKSRLQAEYKISAEALPPRDRDKA